MFLDPQVFRPNLTITARQRQNRKIRVLAVHRITASSLCRRILRPAARREDNCVDRIIWSGALRRVGILDKPASRKNSALTLYDPYDPWLWRHVQHAPQHILDLLHGGWIW